MNSSQAKEKTAQAEREKATADPFASDIFADSKTKEDLKSEVFAASAAIEERPVWVWRLPKVSRSAVDWDALWKNLPADFSDELPRSLADSLATYLNLTDENLIEFLFFIKRETNETPEENNNSWWASVGIEGGAAEFAIEIDDGFAVWLVDAMLGEKISDLVSVRDLTASEAAVLEFLAVNLTHEANRIVNAPLFKFRSLSRKVPVWAIRKNATDLNSLLVSTWQTVHGFQQSIIKLYLAPESLKALQADENKLLTRAPRHAAMWRSLQNRVKDVRARIFFGEAQVTLSDAAGLETGDVVLLENYNFTVSNNDFYGNAEIFLGDGERVKIVGAFESFEDESPDGFEETAAAADNEFIVRRIKSNHALQFSIELVEELESPQFLEESMPEENINLTDESEASFDDEAGGVVPIENLAVTLRVELEARRLSLAEVGNLRAGQVIELGARATDPVNLLIDNKVIARGELVEVDERLGVRIVQILR